LINTDATFLSRLCLLIHDVSKCNEFVYSGRAPRGCAAFLWHKTVSAGIPGRTVVLDRRTLWSCQSNPSAGNQTLVRLLLSLIVQRPVMRGPGRTFGMVFFKSSGCSPAASVVISQILQTAYRIICSSQVPHERVPEPRQGTPLRAIVRQAP
jgi:hypothetical protein